MQPRVEEERSRIWDVLTFAGISLTTLTWIPVLVRGDTILELPNVVQLAFILLLPGVLLFSRPAPLVHVVFLLLLAWSLVMLIALSLHGSPGGSGYIQQQTSQALFGWSLALCIANGRVRINRVAIVALVIIFAALEFSAISAGSSALLGAFDFVTTLDRTTFVYRVLRPALNAFTNQEGDIVYLASQVNNVANMIVVLGCLAFFSGAEERNIGIRLFGNTLALLALIFAFIMFSSSAVLVMAMFALVSAIHITLRLPSHLRNLVLLAILTVTILLFQPVNRFLDANLSEDEASRSVRIEQAKAAFGAINESVLTGVGQFHVGANLIHNWMLFSWATAGIVAFLLVLAVYFMMAFIAVVLCKAAPKGTPTVVALLTLFLVRTSVGGSGGIPSGPAVLAAALICGLIARHSVRVVRPLARRAMARSLP